MKRQYKKTKWIIIIILLLIIIITSFKSGEKFYILKNTAFDTTQSKANSTIARWYFNAMIIY